jgi:acetylornithine deacetylase/succinyl-diaminopimelate desuccinylase-like protein
VKQNDRFLEEASKLEDRTASFLADVIERPSLPCREHQVVQRIGEEMTELGFDEVIVDGLGSVIGRIGDGPVILVYDSHIDVVDVGDPSQWTSDPFTADVRNGIMYGRGASDNKAAIATMVPGAALIKRLGIDASRFTLSVIGTVQEVASAGKLGIPTIGFGPANEAYAHSTQDQCPIDHLVPAVAWYAAFPDRYLAAAGHASA